MITGWPCANSLFLLQSKEEAEQLEHQPYGRLIGSSGAAIASAIADVLTAAAGKYEK